MGEDVGTCPRRIDHGRERFVWVPQVITSGLVADLERGKEGAAQAAHDMVTRDYLPPVNGV